MFRKLILLCLFLLVVCTPQSELPSTESIQPQTIETTYPETLNKIYVNGEEMLYNLDNNSTVEDIYNSGRNVVYNKNYGSYFILCTVEKPYAEGETTNARRVIGEYILKLKAMYWCESMVENKYDAHWQIKLKYNYNLHAEYSPEQDKVIAYNVTLNDEPLAVNWYPYSDFYSDNLFNDCIYLSIEDFCKLFQFNYTIDYDKKSIYFTSL